MRVRGGGGGVTKGNLVLFLLSSGPIELSRPVLCFSFKALDSVFNNLTFDLMTYVTSAESASGEV